MATSKKTSKSAEIKQLKKLLDAYDSVIADISVDIGWPKRLHKKIVQGLIQREWELEHIWLAELEDEAEKDL